MRTSFKHVLDALNDISPPKLAAPWDNVGLLVENHEPTDDINRLLLITRTIVFRLKDEHHKASILSLSAINLRKSYSPEGPIQLAWKKGIAYSDTPPSVVQNQRMT